MTNSIGCGERQVDAGDQDQVAETSDQDSDTEIPADSTPNLEQQEDEEDKSSSSSASVNSGQDFGDENNPLLQQINEEEGEDEDEESKEIRRRFYTRSEAESEDSMSEQGLLPLERSFSGGYSPEMSFGSLVRPVFFSWFIYMVAKIFLSSVPKRDMNCSGH